MYIFWEFAGYRPLHPYAALPEILDCPNSSPGTMGSYFALGTRVSHREPIPKPLKQNQHLQIVLPLHTASWGGPGRAVSTRQGARTCPAQPVLTLSSLPTPAGSPG
jgi:hypothetical protein